MSEQPFSSSNVPESATPEAYLRYEKLPVMIFGDADSGAEFAAREVATAVQAASSRGGSCRIAIDTGSALTPLYEELVEMYRKGSLSFDNVTIYAVTEYHPIPIGSSPSTRRYLRQHLIDPMNLPDSGVRFLDTVESAEEFERELRENGGFDVVILGIGSRGHVGFNAPGSPIDSKTRIVALDRATIVSAAADFYGEEYVPRRAWTLGIETLMRSERVFLVAWGEGAAPTIRSVVEDDPSDQVPASAFQRHTHATLLIDEAAAAGLTRVKTPWVVDRRNWDDRLTRKGVVWLCQETGKPILKLTDRDYNENHMNDLLNVFGSAYAINIKVFNELQHTITGWPGGKPNADDSQRPERATPARKRVVIFSPHPDDDVISMGGTFLRLVDQGHDVHVAYQTSGSVAVFDDDVVQYAGFVRDLHEEFGYLASDAAALYERVQSEMAEKEPGGAESAEIKALKRLIRRSEARASCRLIGIGDEKIHFLDMPFYDTGEIRKNPLGSRDRGIVTELLNSVRPHQIYAAGDLSDPHGTHRICWHAIVASLRELQREAWIEECRVWLYRGAWHEWPIDEIDMAVPMSPDELKRKRRAIFKHQSQKDSALFPGSDSREFWQRAEARNRGLADLYNRLGFAEYEAIEGFKRYFIPGS